MQKFNEITILDRNLRSRTFTVNAKLHKRRHWKDVLPKKYDFTHSLLGHWNEPTVKEGEQLLIWNKKADRVRTE